MRSILVSFNESGYYMSYKGKILILELNGKLLSLLIRDNQILSIQVQKQHEYAVGNIYVGKVKNIAENIGAAFVDLGQGYLTFLPLTDVKYAYVMNRKADGRLIIGDEIPVQIIKEPMKTKLAGVTTQLSLSGQYAVVGIRHPKYGKNSDVPAVQTYSGHDVLPTAAGETHKHGMVQVSSKLSKKQQLRFRSIESLQQMADRYRLIVRTNAGELTEDISLVAEANRLADRLNHIMQIADKRTCYSCLYRGKPEYIHFIENAYTAEYDEIITDLPEIYEVLKEHEISGNDSVQTAVSVRFYEDIMLPLYKLYAVETRISELMNKKVWLKSGGYLVIEPTEALISIDVNSGKYERGKDKEETVFKLNMEAAEMIAVHLRARNLSGMILVDFINMKDKAHEEQLMEYMRSLLKKDSVTADVVDMTGLGLMEITRKKVNPSFQEQYESSANF